MSACQQNIDHHPHTPKVGQLIIYTIELVSGRKKANKLTDR